MRWFVLSIVLLNGCVTVSVINAGRDAKGGAQDVGTVSSDKITTKADVPVSLIPK
jgi:hypothetical protein